MANDVSIIVEASLGDTLIKLDLAKHAINDLGDEAEQTAVKQDEAAASTGFFSTTLGTLNQVTASSIPLLGGLGVPLQAIPILALAGAVAVVALADAVGTLIAIVADLVAPVTLVIGLMGLLSGGFLLAAKNAFGSGGALSGALDGLKKQFGTLIDTLTNRFMPVFRFLADAAKNALTYLNQIAKLPLAEAFKSLATTGVQAVTKFLGQIGSLLAKPFRLAVQIAFGTGKGGNTVASAVSGLWKSFTDYLFGYTVRHPVELRPGVFKIKATTVDGALQPILDWFNRHNFTAQGTKIGHQLLNGLRPLAKPMGQFLVTVFEDAFKTVLGSFFHFLSTMQARNRAIAVQLGKDFLSLIGQAFDALLAKAQAIWHSIGSVARAAIMTIVAVVAGPLVGAWAAVAGAISGIIGLINSAVGAVQSLVGALQSAASIASSVAGALGGGSSSSTAGRTGQGGNSPGRPHVMGSRVMVNHFHLNGSDHASFSRQVRQIGRELSRQQTLLAGGH